MGLLPFLPGHHLLLPDIKTFFVLFCLYVQKWLIFSKLCHPTEKRPPASCFYPDSWCSWSYRLNWLKAADFGPSDNNISKDSSALLGQIWLALFSVKRTKTHQHWNLRITQKIVDSTHVLISYQSGANVTWSVHLGVRILKWQYGSNLWTLSFTFVTHLYLPCQVVWLASWEAE